MCELLAAAWPEPTPFGRLMPHAVVLERMGVAGFGWGVAWVTDDGRVRVHRGLGRYADEAPRDTTLRTARSSRFLIHLRRPSKLSTIQLPDTQPFTDSEGAHAFCHNGFLERAEHHRATFADRLTGRADSEVGWAHFSDRVAGGLSAEKALADVEATFGGTVNLGYLGADGTLLLHAANHSNPVWSFGLDGAVMAATALHSADESLFDLVFWGATDRSLAEFGGRVVVGQPSASVS